MLKKIIAISLLTLTLMVSGCSDTDQAGEDRLASQTLLDSGDYAGVIALLEPTDSLTTDDEYLILAAAYMGQAGFGLTDIIGLMTASNDTNSTGFSSFASSIASGKSSTALSDLGKAGEYYAEVVPDCTALDLTSSEKDVCLFIGLSSMVKTATALSYLGDLSTLGTGSNDELNASMIALQYAIDGTPVPGVVVEAGANETFTSTNSYRPLEVTVNTVPYYYLMTDAAPGQQTIITDGNCTLDFTTCTTANNTDCWACPVVQTAGEADLTVATLLADVLNNGLDAIIAAVGSTSDISADVDAYKTDIDTNLDGIISDLEMITYINSQNQ